jgi:hypothetical protein
VAECGRVYLLLWWLTSFIPPETIEYNSIDSYLTNKDFVDAGSPNTAYSAAGGSDWNRL